MTNPTVTLPREVVQQAKTFLYLLWEKPSKHREAIEALYTKISAALDAPATVDCRGCSVFQSKFQVICDSCTDFDKFQALPPISLTNITKVTK